MRHAHQDKPAHTYKYLVDGEQMDITHFGPCVSYKPDWTREARRISGRPGVKVYFDNEFNFVSIVEKGNQIIGVTRWDEFGKNKLITHATKLRNRKYDNCKLDLDKMTYEQKHDKERQENDWERETHDDLDSYGLREKKHFPQS